MFSTADVHFLSGIARVVAFALNDALTLALSMIVGKRLTYDELIGKAEMEKQKHLLN